MYKCERCGGTFYHFKVAGQCPLCGVYASVRCSCGYTANAREFINNNDNCPKCGMRVYIPAPSAPAKDPDDLDGEEEELTPGETAAGCIGCLVILIIAVVAIGFCSENWDKPISSIGKDPPPATRPQPPGPAEPPPKPDGYVEPYNPNLPKPEREPEPKPEGDYSGLGIKVEGAEYLLSEERAKLYFLLKTRVTARTGKIVLIDRGVFRLKGKSGDEHVDCHVQIEEYSEGGRMIATGSVDYEWLKLTKLGSDKKVSFRGYRVADDNSYIKLTVGTKGEVEINILWPVPADFEHDSAVLFKQFGVGF